MLQVFLRLDLFDSNNSFQHISIILSIYYGKICIDIHNNMIWFLGIDNIGCSFSEYIP